jgi:hypothetical protein
MILFEQLGPRQIVCGNCQKPTTIPNESPRNRKYCDACIPIVMQRQSKASGRRKAARKAKGAT